MCGNSKFILIKVMMSQVVLYYILANIQSPDNFAYFFILNERKQLFSFFF